MADEETFTHTVTELTAGQIREALEGVPDDFPVMVFVAEEPGGSTAETQVVISAGSFNGHFEIDCEFPSGEYYRRHR